MERSGVRRPGCYDDGVIHCAGRFQRTHNLGDFTLFLAYSHVYTNQVAALLVDDGIYKGEGNVEVDFKGKAITVRSVNGSSATIIDCQNLYKSGFLFRNGEIQSSILRGFTITKSKGKSGGGIYCDNASPTISKCVIIDNQTDNGGGIYCINNSSPSFVDCVVTNNLVSRNGGAIYASNNSTLSVTRCIISDNRASNGGGIYCINNSSLIIVNCVVVDNRVSENGGGIYCGASSPSI